MRSERAPVRIAGTFLVFALTWILTSDWALELVAADYAQFAKLQTYKGLAFVAAMAAVIYALVRAQMLALVQANNELVRSAELLHAAHDRQQLALSAAQLGSWTYDLVADTIRCDERSAEHFGVAVITPAATLLLALHIDDQPRARAGYELMLSGKACPPEDYRFRQPDGTYRWVAINMRLGEVDGSGRVLQALGTSQDITHRKNWENALKASEALLKSATNNTGVGLVVLDKDRRYTFANRAFSSILGLSEDIIGKSPRELLKGTYEAQIKPKLDLAFAGEKVSFELIGPVDTSKHYSVIYDPRKDEVGDIASVTVIIFEITELRRSEQALRNSEQRLKHVLSATGEGIWDWTISTDIVQHNARWCQLLGLDDSYLEHPVQTFFDLIYAEDRAAVQAAVKGCLEGTKPYFSQHRICRAHGELIWVEDRGAVVERNADGTAARMVGSMIDVTERKLVEEQQVRLFGDLQRSESEARQQRALQQSIFDCSPDGMVLVDLDRNITNINPAFTRIFGYDLSDLEGKHASIIYATQEDCDRVGAHIAAGRDGLIDQPLNCRRKGGELFPVQMTGAKLLGSSNNCIGYLGVYRDISIELARESALREKQRLEALGRLTGGIAHDSNNLLTVISGNVQLIEMRLEDKRLTPYLNEISRASDMGARLNERLITFARQRDLESVPLNLNTLIKTLEELIHRSIGENCQLVTDLTADPAVVRIDPSEMENAVLNLALNARDAMPLGGIIRLETKNIEVDAENSPLLGSLVPGQYILLRVSDTGVGMSHEVMSRAFEPFFTTKESCGTGLGLTTIHGFIQQSAGHISLQSELGHGTAVNIYLPILTGSEARPDSCPAVETLIKGRGETILLVEDQSAVRSVTRDRLQSLGYEVVEAENGAAALAYMASGARIDLIFSDVVMPGGPSGFELAQRVHTRYPTLKMLLTSGFPDDVENLRRLPGKPQHILRKPYSLEDLSSSVSSALASAE